MKSFGVALVFLSAVLTVSAQTGTNAAPRAMSLADCIQQALSHNLDVQIERYNPQISLYNLNAAYGGYDPTLNLSGQHLYNESGVDSQNGLSLPGSVSDENTFSSSLNGLTPWAMSYTLSANVSETYGTSYSVETNILVSPFDNSGGSIGASLTQPLLKNFWIDSTRLTIRVAKNRLQYSEQGLRGQIITSVTAVEDAYDELIYAQENVKVEQEALGLAQTLLNDDNQRVQIKVVAERGGTIEQDEAQVASSQANLIAAQNTLSVDENTLKSLLTDNYSQWHDTDIQPTATLAAPLQSFNLQDSWNKGLNGRPDLKQAQANVEQQGIELKFYRNQLFPQLDLIGTVGYNGAAREFSGTFNQFGEGDRPFYSYGAQLSIPLSNTGPRNQYKTAKATREQLVLQLKQLEQNIMVEIDNAVKLAQSRYESVEATRSARIYAEAALNAEQEKYKVGKSTTFTVLQLQNNLTAARSNEIRALADYNEALANLADQEGSTLERNGISLEAK